MKAAHEHIEYCLSEESWNQLNGLEALHCAIRENHERVIRSLDAAVAGEDRRQLQRAWNEYRAVVADLSRVTEDIESLRLSAC